MLAEGDRLNKRDIKQLGAARRKQRAMWAAKEQGKPAESGSLPH